MSQQASYDIIVIGAGCGGLTAALCAAKEGKKVLLLERHNSPGGLFTGFVRGRFEFDVLPETFCGSNDAGLSETQFIFEDLGVSRKIPTSTVPFAFRIITKARNGEIIDAALPFGIKEFTNKMNFYVPGCKQAITKMFDVAREIKSALNTLSQFENQPNYSELNKFLKEYRNFAAVSAYSAEEILNVLGVPVKARDILEPLWIKYGVDLSRLGFTDFIVKLYDYINFGGVYPTLRSHALPMALASAIEDNGGEIRYNSHVTRITFEDNHTSGVILKNGERISAKHIICNCSPTTVYGKMIKKADVPPTANKRSNARIFGGRSACVYLGLNKSPQELGITDYEAVISETCDSAKQFNLMKNIETNNSLTAVCPNVVNPDCSPKGTTVLCLYTSYTDNCWANVIPEEYFNQKDLLAARLIANYENTTGINIHSYIEEIETATPVTFARYTNAPQGVTGGYLPVEWDGMLPRFLTEKTDNDIKGLRFCGSWGTQLSDSNGAIATGRNTAYATISDIDEEEGI